jgi:hypothetical protein
LQSYLAPTVFASRLFLPLLLRALAVPSSGSISLSSLRLTLRSIALLAAGLLISLTATLNFGLSLFLSLYLFFTLLFIPAGLRQYPPSYVARRRAQQVLFAMLSPTGAWAVWRVFNREGAEAWVVELLRSWKLGGGWSLPVALAVVGPIVAVQATSVLL